MLIKTITCHEVYNHGASLQAYALMKYLQNKGHQVEIIDYKPSYLTGKFNFLSINHPDWNTSFIKKIIYLVAKFPGRLLSLKRKYIFDQFTQKYLKITQRKYLSNEELKRDPPIADIYICGSDQIWNSVFPNGKDPAFYLDFAPESKVKISYAASFATKDIPEESTNFVKKKINNLDCISVRESSGIKILERLGIQQGTQVADPVFLLDRDEWDHFCNYQINEKYLFVYDFDKSDLVKKIAIAVAKAQKIKIYSVNNYKCNYADRNFQFAGPEMFISLIKNAEFIISNSFHGTAFSIIFEKNFCVVNRKENINTRMADLLTSLAIEKRLVDHEMDIAVINSDIDYSKVNIKVNNLKLKSKQFLNDSINGKNK